LVPVGAGVVYALLTRAAFGSPGLSDLFATLSLGFLVFTPLALGLLVVVLAPPALGRRWRFALAAPLVSCLLFMALVLLARWEAAVSLAMALPIFLGVAALGGGLGWALRLTLARQSSWAAAAALLVVLAAPYVVTPLERSRPPADSLRTTAAQIEIQAAPGVVWGTITRFRLIGPEEQQFSWFHLAGLPRPLEATLSADGVGALRRGQWEDGLAFNEVISDWEFERGFTMQLEADTSQVTGGGLPLGGIGGPYFDVLSARYELEVLGPERVILHLTTVHRLSTSFNAYGGLWTDFFLRDLSSYLLRIAKTRSEAGAG
jgi:hypothetical protein